MQWINTNNDFYGLAVAGWEEHPFGRSFFVLKMNQPILS